MHFFFYGTLVAGSDNATARAVHARLRAIAPASVAGALWAIPEAAGWYPALVVEPAGRVQGVLYAAADDFGADDLARLDRWEDYHPEQPAASLYLRVALPIVDAHGASVSAQVYRFNQSLPDDALAIPAGDFPAWLAATGYAAYSG